MDNESIKNKEKTESEQNTEKNKDTDNTEDNSHITKLNNNVILTEEDHSFLNPLEERIVKDENYKLLNEHKEKFDKIFETDEGNRSVRGKSYTVNLKKADPDYSSPKSDKSEHSGENLKVFIRVRPAIEREIDPEIPFRSIVQITDNKNISLIEYLGSETKE